MRHASIVCGDGGCVCLELGIDVTMMWQNTIKNQLQMTIRNEHILSFLLPNKYGETYNWNDP